MLISVSSPYLRYPKNPTNAYNPTTKAIPDSKEMLMLTLILLDLRTDQTQRQLKHIEKMHTKVEHARTSKEM